MESINVKKLSAGTVFKLSAIGASLGIMTVSIFFGILGLFGLETIKWNNEYVTGFSALLISPLIGLIGSLFGTLFISGLTWIGLWVYGFFKPLRIEFVKLDAQTSDSDD